MSYNSNFDIESVMKTLGTVSDKYPQGSAEDEALRIAAVALLYVQDIDKLEDYRKYFLDFITGKPLIPDQAFATREEADEWLASGKVNGGELITIAGQGFSVGGMASKGWTLLRTRLPEETEPPGSK
ncbi:hypothetical protein [Archangium violaceum]|uniref:Uncharacterized protein n=1 Tax=Archangium violaceum Cb vi76 TaxID=1406225 RepID=A0A084SLY7_9BACT|nr:hypothetical protein [Archangium violaceum]KFA89472.1 hypothetical protein Q664_34400 [Archangium violaceum Cb vi76]